MAKIICYHPNLYSTQWNESKSKPSEMIVCKCDKNKICLICGYGSGIYPCDCHKINNKINNIIDCYYNKINNIIDCY